MSVIAQTMCARLSESITREGLETAVELLAPISVLEIRTVSTPFVEMSAYWRRGWEPFSIQTRWTLLRSSITPVISTGFDVFRFDMMVWVALSFSVLFAVSCRVSDGSRNETSVEREGANSDATMIEARNNVSCFFRVI